MVSPYTPSRPWPLLLAISDSIIIGMIYAGAVTLDCRGRRSGEITDHNAWCSSKSRLCRCSLCCYKAMRTIHPRRTEPDIRHVLSQKRLEKNIITVERHKNACHIDQTVARTIANVAVFNESLDQDGNDEGTKRDPDAIMELYYYLNCQLLTHPEPLRDIQEVVAGELPNQKPRWIASNPSTLQ